MVLGVLFINNANDTQGEEISGYINCFIEKIKENTDIDSFRLLIETLKKNLSVAIILWFAGLTVVRCCCSLWDNRISRILPSDIAFRVL